jgi:hypothetical protein
MSSPRSSGPPYSILYADGEAAPRNRFLKYVDFVEVALRGRFPSGEGEEFEVDYAKLSSYPDC